jgi:hypothetical protein
MVNLYKITFNIRLDIFTATKFYEVFLGKQVTQSLPSTLKMETELVLETSEHFNILTRLLAQEIFIEIIFNLIFKTGLLFAVWAVLNIS